MKSIRPIRINHMNVVMEDFDETLAYFQKVYDAEFILDLPKDYWHAALISIGDVIFEPFCPHTAFLHHRHGPHHVGLEYQVEDMEVARELVAARGMRITRDLTAAIYTHPDDSFGIAFEFYGDEFHTREYELLGGKRMRPASWWRDEHPLGLTGQKGYTVAVTELEAPRKFYEELLRAQPLYEEDRPAVGARVVGLQVADTFVELLAPTGEGMLRSELERLGPGIWSTVFGVRDIEQARRHLAGHGIELKAGTADDRWSCGREANRGVIFEFAE